MEVATAKRFATTKVIKELITLVVARDFPDNNLNGCPGFSGGDSVLDTVVTRCPVGYPEHT
jgi:hypothetical protein